MKCKTNTGLSKHVYESKHTIDFNNVKILDHEKNYYKRRVKEAIYINSIPNNINLQIDKEFLNPVYRTIINNIFH
jgi:hypothetical protein